MTLREAFPDIGRVDVTVLGAFSGVTGTSVDPYELLVLCAIQRHFRARKVLEIGTFDGGTTLNLARNAGPDGEVVTVDLPLDWDGTYKYDIPGSYVNETSRSQLGQRFTGTTYESKIRQVLGDSASLDWEKVGSDFDLAFIDGNHFYDYVVSDTANVLRTLRSGGIVVWHDYGDFPDVSRAVDESRLPVSVIQGTRLAVAVTR